MRPKTTVYSVQVRDGNELQHICTRKNKECKETCILYNAGYRNKRVYVFCVASRYTRALKTFLRFLRLLSALHSAIIDFVRGLGAFTSTVEKLCCYYEYV